MHIEYTQPYCVPYTEYMQSLHLPKARSPNNDSPGSSEPGEAQIKKIKDLGATYEKGMTKSDAHGLILILEKEY